jgi:hypothetical protein
MKSVFYRNDFFLVSKLFLCENFFFECRSRWLGVPRGGTITLLFKSKYFLIYGAELPQPVSHILKEKAKNFNMIRLIALHQA